MCMLYEASSQLTEINIENTGNQPPPGLLIFLSERGEVWLPAFPVLIYVSWEPADNAKMVNNVEISN